MSPTRRSLVLAAFAAPVVALLSAPVASTSRYTHIDMHGFLCAIEADGDTDEIYGRWNLHPDGTLTPFLHTLDRSFLVCSGTQRMTARELLLRVVETYQTAKEAA